MSWLLFTIEFTLTEHEMEERMLNKFKIKDKVNTEEHLNCKNSNKSKPIVSTWPRDVRNGILKIGTPHKSLQGMNIQISLKG